MEARGLRPQTRIDYGALDKGKSAPNATYWQKGTVVKIDGNLCDVQFEAKDAEHPVQTGFELADDCGNDINTVGQDYWEQFDGYEA